MPNDEASIIQLHQEFGAAWSRGDSSTAAAFFTEDGIRVGAAGDMQRGRSEIAAALGRLRLETHPKLFPPPPK